MHSRWRVSACRPNRRRRLHGDDSHADAKSAASPPPAPTPAYAPSTCSFHLTEMQTWTSDDKNLFAIIKLVDNNKADIGHTTVSDTFPVGESISVSNPYRFHSKLPNTLTITGEHQKYYLQFTYGSLQWTSRDTKGPATCSNGGWDPRNGPICGRRAGNHNAVNNMDCSFPC